MPQHFYFPQCTSQLTFDLPNWFILLLSHPVTALNKKTPFPAISLQFFLLARAQASRSPLHFSSLTDPTLLLSAFLSDEDHSFLSLTRVKSALCSVGPCRNRENLFALLCLLKVSPVTNKVASAPCLLLTKGFYRVCWFLRAEFQINILPFPLVKWWKVKLFGLFALGDALLMLFTVSIPHHKTWQNRNSLPVKTPETFQLQFCLIS